MQKRTHIADYYRAFQAYGKIVAIASSTVTLNSKRYAKREYSIL
ncbi:hypothetical protein [Anabaena subtropica]|nr:hypothetical protein [Anabaena subtropica]